MQSLLSAMRKASESGSAGCDTCAVQPSDAVPGLDCHIMRGELIEKARFAQCHGVAGPMVHLDATEATCRSLLALQHPNPRVPTKPAGRVPSARAPFHECCHSIILVQSNASNSAVNSLTQRSWRSFDSARAFRCMSVSGSSNNPAWRERKGCVRRGGVHKEMFPSGAGEGRVAHDTPHTAM